MIAERRLSRARLARWGEAVAAFTVTVVILAQLCVVGHYALVAHYLCAVHHTLHHGHPPAVRILVRPKSASSVIPVWSGKHGTHDECSFPARHRKAVMAPECTPRIDSQPAVAPLIVSSVERPVLLKTPRYRTAPKQSPPSMG